MNDYIVDIKDLTDSRELLESKPPLVIKLFIYLLLFMVVAGIIWISLFSIEITVKAPGIIRPQSDISVVRNMVSGKINLINYQDGNSVKQGDLLYSIEDLPFRLEYDEIISRISVLTEKEENTLQLRQSIDLETNQFTSSQIGFYNRFLLYQMEKERLNVAYLAAARNYDDENSLLDSMKTQRKLDELESLERLAKLALDSYVSQTLVQIENELISLREQIIALTRSKSTLEENLNKCQITASISGQIQKIQDLNPGDFLTLGSEVLRILPSERSNIKVDIMVSNKDIARITEGVTISYRFSALPQNEYGVLTGLVTSIPGDVSSYGTSGNVYVVEGSVDADSLRNQEGEEVFFMPGMFCDARIIVREQRILDYLLEKLDLKS